jgi:signal transduction histidine kinase
VAHEFNNLMTVVVGSVERAAIRALDERQSGHLGRADVAARRAGQLAAELLSIARRQAAANTVLDLNEVVHASRTRCVRSPASGCGSASTLRRSRCGPAWTPNSWSLSC